MSGASNSMPVLFEDCEIWHITMVTENVVLFLNFCLRILLRQVPSERDLSQQPGTYHNGYEDIITEIRQASCP